MKSVIKQWADGGNLTATYEGSGDGSAVFSSDEYEGIDREQSVIFKDVNNTVQVERIVRQDGKRQQFRTKDGLVFRVKGGGRFGVLKSETALEPPIIEPFTRLEYIETSDTQWINSDIKSPLKVEARLQGVRSSGSSRIVLSLSGSSSAGGWFGFTTIWTLGSTSTFDNAYDEIVDVTCSFDGSQAEATIDGVTVSRKGSRSGLLYIGSSASSYPSYCRIYKARVYEGDVLVRDFIPVLDKDNVACMYDNVSGEYFYNQGTGEFIAGYK